MTKSIQLALALAVLAGCVTPKKEPKSYVEVRELTLHEKPSGLSESKGSVSYRQPVEVVDRNGDWAKIIIEGWVHNSGLSQSQITPTTNLSNGNVAEFEAAVGIVMERLTNGVNNTAASNK